MPLTQLGRYRIIAELGRGAMGVVYKAEDPLLNRIVAVKTILMSSDADERAEYEARFYQEAKAAGGLNHPNIVTIHDMGREGDVAFMSMELIDGVDLRELMKSGPLPLALAFDIAEQVADGLAFAHEHGVVHRDIKPANIMIVRGRHAKIMDFGIAKVRLSDVKTQTGAMLGSPKYMSPEQLNGERADHRSDIFSLGVMVYEMLTGTVPFSAAELGQLMYQISTAPAPPPSSVNAALPTMADLILAKALEKLPEQRYQDARELVADLRSCRAQIDDPAAALPSAVDAPLSIDIGLEATAAIDVAAKTQSRADTTKTQKLGATILPGPAVLQFALCRRFDSSRAVERLGQIGQTGRPEPNLLSQLKRVLQDPGHRGLTITVAAALLMAAIIVVL